MPDAAKIVAATYMAIMAFVSVPIVLDPLIMYRDSVGEEDLDATPPTALAAMKHMSCVFAFLQILSASIIVCEVFTHNSPRLGMSSIVCFWMFNAFIQFAFPFPTTTGAAITIFGISFQSAMPFIIVFTAMGTYGYIHSPQDKAVIHDKKSR